MVQLNGGSPALASKIGKPCLQPAGASRKRSYPMGFPLLRNRTEMLVVLMVNGDHLIIKFQARFRKVRTTRSMLNG